MSGWQVEYQLKAFVIKLSRTLSKCVLLSWPTYWYELFLFTASQLIRSGLWEWIRAQKAFPSAQEEVMLWMLTPE